MDFQNEIGDLQRKITQCQEGIARRRTMFESLVVESGQTILDLGCGGGHLVHELALAVGSDGYIVGVDPSPNQIAAARKLCTDLENVEFKADSATDLSFNDSMFDSVTSTQVLEYVKDVDKSLTEIHRVLKKGGRFCAISVLWDHWRFHGPEPDLNEEIHNVFRDHCFHQMLPLDMPRKLLSNSFSGIHSAPIGFINQVLHNNSFALWSSKVISAFAINNGMSKDKVMAWNKQLKEADREGRFGFVSMPVLTTAIAV